MPRTGRTSHPSGGRGTGRDLLKRQGVRIGPLEGLGPDGVYPETKEGLEEERAEDFSVLGIAEKLGIVFRAHRRFGSRLPALAIEAWRRGLIATGGRPSSTARTSRRSGRR